MNSRAKGVAYEREVADLWEAHGFAVRGLEASGDHLVVCRDGLLIGQECKRRERLDVPGWWRQTITDAPPGAVPILTFRQSRRESLSVIRTADLARLLAR